MKKLLSREDRSILLACLCISFIIWLLGTLNEQYKATIPLTVNYINLPKNKVLTKAPKTLLQLHVAATGSDLVRKAGIFKQALDVDYARFNKRALPTFSLINEFEEKLEINIIDIEPDTIKFHLDKKSTRYLPIQFTGNLQSKKGFDIKDNSILLKPDSVKISGPSSILDTMQFWRTDTLTLTDIAKEQTGDIALQTPVLEGFYLFKKTVAYTIPVIQYTEKAEQVSIKAINLPEGKKVFLHPKKVRLTYSISQDNYSEIDSSDFKVVADFSNFDLETQQEIDIEIKEQPSAALVKGARVSPNVAEFIVIE